MVCQSESQGEGGLGLTAPPAPSPDDLDMADVSFVCMNSYTTLSEFVAAVKRNYDALKSSGPLPVECRLQCREHACVSRCIRRLLASCKRRVGAWFVVCMCAQPTQVLETARRCKLPC